MPDYPAVTPLTRHPSSPLPMKNLQDVRAHRSHVEAQAPRQRQGGETGHGADVAAKGPFVTSHVVLQPFNERCNPFPDQDNLAGANKRSWRRRRQPATAELSRLQSIA